ncbi:MAG: phosphate propanoyltransferase [Oscillospiraceae bacterium]|nr:phosphate propanoyltransferase [Oscillospiraceae bacterium]
MQYEDIVQQVMDRIFVELEASGRHVHVTEAQAQALFGHRLTPKRELSQPGQYLANERVTVIGPKGRFENVAVLGPERKAGQVELSVTDTRTLGIPAPVRMSGDIGGTPGAILQGNMGTATLREGVIVARRHIHITPKDAEQMGVQDKQVVRLQVYTDRPLIFEDVVVRVSPDFQTRVHLDYDEANACGFQNGDLGRILQ